MASPSLSRVSRPAAYLWTFPECPVRIHLSFQLIERLRADILPTVPLGREIGGLLIGNQAPNGDIEIFDSVPLMAEAPAAAQHFVIRAESISQAIQTCAVTQRRVVGFYRSHLDQRVHLRPEDLVSIHAWFKDPVNVFLVIRPHDGRASAGFFFWQDGKVFADYSLTFPFSASELKSRAWSTLVGGAPRPSLATSLFSRARQILQETSAGVKFALAVGLLVILGIIGFFSQRDSIEGALRNRQFSTDASHPLGLRVARDGLNLLVGWDRSVPEIVNARDANLLIWDGSSQPLFVSLTPAQLRSGSVSYASGSDKVTFRLDVIGMSGNAKTESILSISRSPYASPSTVDPSRPPVDLAREPSVSFPSRAPVPVRDPIPTSVREPIPYSSVRPATPADLADSRSVQAAAERPKTAYRTFVPAGAPSSTLAPRLAELSEPPNLPGGEAIAPTFHVNSGAPPPPPPPVAKSEPDLRPPTPTASASNLPQANLPQANLAQTNPAPTSPARTQPAPPPSPKAFSSSEGAEAVRAIQPSLSSAVRLMIKSDNVVEVQVRIDENGKVVAAKPISAKGAVAGFLARSAVEAAMGWQFRPAKLNGKAIASEKTLQFLFRPPNR